MHETGVVRDLMKRVEAEVGFSPVPVGLVRFRIGALAGIGTEALRDGARHYALEQWGYSPEVEVELSDDLTDPGALGVVLISIGMEG